ncbi:MAG: hypothetical protein AB2L09_08220 [Coriobacteriia bacterium]
MPRLLGRDPRRLRHEAELGPRERVFLGPSANVNEAGVFEQRKRPVETVIVGLDAQFRHVPALLQSTIASIKS